MLARQRQAIILEETRRTGAVRVSDLVARLGVSDMTVRRDLDVLASRGLVEKVYGGATSVGGTSIDEPGFEAKSVRQRAQKEAIAELAATLVRPGTAIGLSAGTTTWTLARALDHVPGLTVVTNSIRVADVLRAANQPDRTVVLTGGVRTPSDALVGPVAVHSLRTLHLDMVFLGVHGMAEGPGFTTPNLTESETDRALVEAGRTLVVLADSTKWATIGISTIAELAEAHVVVTDDGLPDHARKVLAEHVGELMVAPARGAARSTPRCAGDAGNTEDAC
ncbi:DNA-binding transcriptional regulator of sugar metabolism, DeoR/GlpR family [Amycolatopsis arida]|uniref:DNA-binding transcriptional regulator of sugar metabolism, DeoR/GlpR family n=1 Tax=Amycolatopsis arida TaxID=587909 RepID=A0A1I5Q7H3_9PSEU|nr:DeoR/GlpR family DNA-binding transcription regulator [Amycolatopsis arida]TDX98743.1 DeoR/GlpR family transcriptional regulator of sugar metabolism [Amycolatopsis arida]SFP42233.1 DNA-binding transcriptional regulator of sugar metabolism, DeoR/GlpR family [Amycolatopsis arida]